MALAMEPQRKRMAVGSGGFQACPNFWHVVLPEGPGQLSKAFGVVSKAKAHPLASCSQLGLHAGFGDVEAKHRQRDSDIISGVHFLFSFRFFILVYWPLWLFEDTRHWRHACMRAFCWIDFALDTIRLHKPEVGRRSQSTAKLFCLSHGTVFLRPRLKSLRDSRLNKFRGTREDTSHGPVSRRLVAKAALTSTGHRPVATTFRCGIALSRSQNEKRTH